MNCLIGPKNVSRGDTSASSADIECFGEFDEFSARYICSSQEDGTCRRMRGERRVDEDSTNCPFLRISIFKWRLCLGTEELVRIHAPCLPEDGTENSSKSCVISQLWVGIGKNNFFIPGQ